MTPPGSPAAALAALWRAAGGDPAALARTQLTGDDPVLPSTFRVGTAALASIGAAALAAAELWRLRTGRAQDVAVDARAAAAAFRTERYLRVAGMPAPVMWSGISGFYRTGDGRWIQLHCNFPHHRDGVLAVLGCADRPAEVAARVAAWKAQALEDALAAAGMCAALVRTAAEWQAHPQGRAAAEMPVLEVVRIGDAPPAPLADGDRPLSGVRVLDLTRVIAGPVCGRTLAEHGADVLHVTAAHLPSFDHLVVDTGWGKLSARLDLRADADRDRLMALLRDADVFCQSYRPGALAAHGFGPEALAALRPGIVSVTISAYGHDGPWRDRRGFDSLVQSASGIAEENGRAAGDEAPRHLPSQALDHATGQLAAFGAMMALARRAREGGSYLVRVSLAQTGRWLDALGRIDGLGVDEPTVADVDDLLETVDTPFGRARRIRPAARLTETPPRWSRPSVPLGTHEPVWPPGPAA